jgi:hypothetical protein
MHRYIVWFGLACALVSPGRLSASGGTTALSAEAAIRLLHGSGDRVLVDQEGYSFRFFHVQQRPELQSLIDGITARILGTTIGTAICTDLLSGKAELLEIHLGMSRNASIGAAEDCRNNEIWGGSSVVFNEPGSVPTRITSAGITTPRKYVIVVTNRPDFPIESWTESYANQTTLVVHHSSSKSDLNLRYLTQTISHELAIYFDAKSWPWGPGWDRIPELSKIKLSGATREQVSMAALNPAVSTVLSFIRAFKIERQMMRELVAQGKLGPDQVYYPSADFPFLRLGCQGPCLKNFILEQQTWLASLHRSLLAFSPHYLSRKLNSETLNAPDSGFMVTDSFFEVLQSLPLSYMQSFTAGTAFESFIRPATEEELRARAKSNEVMLKAILPADLAILSGATFEFPDRGNAPMDALTYLTIPLLSDLNSNMSSGPRPRIRTGGTR